MTEKKIKVKKVSARERYMTEANENLLMWDKFGEYTEIKNCNDLRYVLSTINSNTDGFFALDTETTSLDRQSCEMLGFSFSATPHTAWWVNRSVVGVDVFNEMLQILNEYTKHFTCIFANAKYDIPVLERHGVEVNKFYDVLIGGRLVNTNVKIFGLKGLGEYYLTGNGPSVVMYKLLGCKKDEVRFDMLNEEQARIYGCQDADLTIQLWHEPKVQRAIEDNKHTWNLEHRLIRPLIKMELNGITIDTVKLAEQDLILQGARDKICDRIDEIATEWHHEPTTINLNSPKQKAELLYGTYTKGKGHNPDHALVDIHGNFLIPPEYTATGMGSTGKIALVAIKDLHEAPALMAKASSYSSQRSNITNKLAEILGDDGRLRSSFAAMQPATGRFSSSGPNLQNIKKSLGEEDLVNLRENFIATPGYTLIDIDYSQIELRVAASLSQEPVWMKAFNEGLSVHKQTAAAIFGENYTDEQYKRAKTANFGILYGQTAKAFSRLNGMTEIEAQQFIDAWMASVPTLVRWIEREKFKATAAGYAKTYFGRRRLMSLGPFDNILSDDYGVKSYWERRAVSHVVQGTAADIMKIAIIRCDERLGDDPTRMLLTVHDEILFETPDSHLAKAVPFLVECMELRMRGWAPVTAEADVGKNWGDLCTLDEWLEAPLGIS